MQRILGKNACEIEGGMEYEKVYYYSGSNRIDVV